MKILVWGIPCVGNDEIGEMLAEKLNYTFYDVNMLIKEKYQTIDNFNNLYPNNYDRFKEHETIALNIIENDNNFVMSMPYMFNKEIIDNINNKNVISVEVTDYLKNIYDRILFYDENDQICPDSKEYRDLYKEHYMQEVKNDMTTSYKEFKNIPKFKLKGRKFEEVIDELVLFINEIKK